MSLAFAFLERRKCVALSGGTRIAEGGSLMNRMRSNVCLGLTLALGLLVQACDGSSTETSTGGAGGETSSTTGGTGGSGGGTTTQTEEPGPWSFDLVSVENLPPVWGGIVAQESGKVAYLVGGVGGTAGPVTANLVRVEQTADGVKATAVTAPISNRYCGCAMVDTNRNELIIIGGRGTDFNETTNVEKVNLTTNEVTALGSPGAAEHPVGCHAVFLADRDEGYIFGGASAQTGFSDVMWRYLPTDGSFTELTAKGPQARYDGVLRYPVEGGPLWLLGGLGPLNGSPNFLADVWSFDPATETWTEVKIQPGLKPSGRRLPWVAFRADMTSLVMGFGSDSPTGASMLGDLWQMDLNTGTWDQQTLGGEVNAGARGFALWLPGPPGSAGLLSGGLEDLGLSKQALVVKSPSDGNYR
ncbi:MAG: hypothetical protein IPK82_21525 [Polyangiaceae bacterium]|nr:hypothetical protein [Polyangiaceae bacterium]